jgi:IclR family transcriptional regulator, acetate operon repressor
VGQAMQSVVSALRVLEAVAKRQPVGVSELARELGLPKSSVQRSLQTLHVAGWIRPASTEVKRWVLTSRALHVGQSGAGEFGLRDCAIPVMESLRRESSETIHLMIPEGRDVVLIERLPSPNPVRIVIPLGGRAPLHASSNGKAILANRRLETVQAFLSGGLPGYTGATIVEPAALLAELSEIRNRGYAVNRGEWRGDIAAVAAAILGHDGEPVASISISAPVTRMPARVWSGYGRLVREAAMEISAALGHTEPTSDDET